MKSKYVIKNKKMANYLFALGLTYIQKQDKNDPTKTIYLFDTCAKLKMAMDFYSEMKTIENV